MANSKDFLRGAKGLVLAAVLLASGCIDLSSPSSDTPWLTRLDSDDNPNDLSWTGTGFTQTLHLHRGNWSIHDESVREDFRLLVYPTASIHITSSRVDLSGITARGEQVIIADSAVTVRTLSLLTTRAKISDSYLNASVMHFIEILSPEHSGRGAVLERSTLGRGSHSIGILRGAIDGSSFGNSAADLSQQWSIVGASEAAVFTSNARAAEMYWSAPIEHPKLEPNQLRIAIGGSIIDTGYFQNTAPTLIQPTWDHPIHHAVRGWADLRGHELGDWQPEPSDGPTTAILTDVCTKPSQANATVGQGRAVAIDETSLGIVTNKLEQIIISDTGTDARTTHGPAFEWRRLGTPHIPVFESICTDGGAENVRAATHAARLTDEFDTWLACTYVLDDETLSPVFVEADSLVDFELFAEQCHAGNPMRLIPA